MFSDVSYKTYENNNLWKHTFIAILVIIGAVMFGKGLYIHAKANVAQLLIAKAWESQLKHGQRTRPWYWADTWPIAVMTFPAHQQKLYVLAGATDAVIAFGPGHMSHTAFPGQMGNSVLIGHRDTHFNFLQHVEKGDLIEIDAMHGSKLYKVENMRIAHESQIELMDNSWRNELTLVTCYPFDGVTTDTEYRYVVTATKIET